VPTQLTFTSQPTASVTETENLGIITVAVQDEDNATVTTSVNVVTVELCTGSPSGTLTGMLSVAAVAGIATFGDLKVVDGTGMDFSLCVSSPFLTGDTSDDFDVTAAPVEPPIPSPTPGGDPISGAPLPFSQQQFFNGPGLANVSGFVCTYQAGTTIPLRTYSDEALTSVNQNPIRLGVAGRPAVSGSEVSIFIEARAYKIVVYARGTGNTCNGVAVGPVVSTRDNVTGPNLATASNIRVAGSVTATGQLISEAPQGRAPIVVRSTTPVDNLVLHPEAYSNTGTQKTDVKHIFGTGTLSGGGTLTVTLSGASTFSGSTSYICTAADETTAAPVRITRTSGTSITFTGTAASAIAYDCIGN
jgi:hypothetical protein